MAECRVDLSATVRKEKRAVGAGEGVREVQNLNIR